MQALELQARLQAAVDEAAHINKQESLFGWAQTKCAHLTWQFAAAAYVASPPWRRATGQAVVQSHSVTDVFRIR